MSFGYSVGDFITLLRLANAVRKRFVDAPGQFKAVSEDVKVLSNVLRDIDDVLPQRDLTSQQKKGLDEIAQGCCEVLTGLEETLDKYQALNSSAKSISERPRRVWNRLQWDQKEADKFRSRITLNINALGTFFGRLTSNASFETKAGVNRLNERQDNRDRREEHQAILDWLTPIDYATQQSDFLSRRQKGTGQWLLDTKEFNDWLTNTNQTLFCPGMPGAGKTIMTSIVVNHLHTTFRNNPTVGIAYLYCNFRRQHEQKAANLLLSLLKQLVQGQALMPGSVKNLYTHHIKERTRPLFDDISRALHSVVANYSRTFIVVDALDECPLFDGHRRKFLREIFDLQTKTAANIFATSRFIPEIEEDFKGGVSLEVRASNEDVKRYLHGHLLQLPSFVLNNSILQEEIQTAITNAVAGMFLLAQLYLGSLIGKRSPKAIKAALQKLPSGSEAYDYAYGEAMERIEGQVTDSRELAKQVLSWITCARRPLTTSELQHALAVEIDASKLDEENLPEIVDMVSVCAGLVTVDEESDIIRLVHYTTQEYFQRTWASWFPNAQTYITEICVTYLLFDAFKTGYCATDEQFEARLRSHVLYDYAARNWGHHARASSIEEGQLVLGLLQSEAKVSASSQAAMTSRDFYYSGYSQRAPRRMTGVHIAAYFKLAETMVTLLKNGHGPDFQDNYGRTPLSYAAGKGNGVVAKLLLTRNDVKPDAKDKYGQTPLSWAAQRGQAAVVRLLLAMDGVNPDAQDIYGRTPLSLAAEKGREVVVNLLLAKDSVNVEAKDKYGRTPLSWAAEKGHEAIVELLFVKHGVDPNSKDTGYDRVPLSYAAERGNEAIVKLLFTRDSVNLDAKDKYGQTPLSLAAQNGHKAIVELLLAKVGVNLDPKDKDGRTPLSWAAEKGHEAVVELLFAKHSVDPNSKDTGCGRVPLSYAAEKGNEAIVKLLLTRDSVSLDAKDKCGQTPLSLAARNGHKAIVELLLAKVGANPEPKDIYGRTPLSWAAEKGHEVVVGLLLAKDGVNPNYEDKYGWKPAWLAAVKGHKTVVELLLAKGGVDLGFNINSYISPPSLAAEMEYGEEVGLILALYGVNRDSWDIRYGQTPLGWAAEKGHNAVVKLLLGKDGADPDSKDSDGRTPLSWAVEKGHEVVVKMLLGNARVNPDIKDVHGRTPLLLAAENNQHAVIKLLLEKDNVELNPRDRNDRTPLLLAVENGHEAVMKLLLGKDGIDLDSKDNDGRTPLSRAAENGYKAVVQLLLVKDGIDPDSRDNNGRTPLSWAAENGHKTVVKLLLATDGVDPNNGDKYGWKPRWWAAAKGHKKVLKLLPN